jgi:predicted P-loop ATPase
MSKDDRLLMAESGLICLEEIVTMTDEEVDQIKAAASLPQVVERAAYARNKEVRPHLASFCGTGNHVQFLTDTSGNRRWLPFEVTDILSPYDHPIDYSGLYSQVLHLWQSGFVYWFDTDEIRSLERHLEQFEAPSLEEELILKHYRKPGATDHAVFRSTADILLRINAGMKQPLSAVKVGIIMKKMGFKQMRLGSGKRGYRLIELSFDEIAREGITDAPPVERQSTLEL